jgi:hypothetical protein
MRLSTFLIQLYVSSRCGQYIFLKYLLWALTVIWETVNHATFKVISLTYSLILWRKCFHPSSLPGACQYIGCKTDNIYGTIPCAIFIKIFHGNLWKLYDLHTAGALKKSINTSYSGQITGWNVRIEIWPWSVTWEKATINIVLLSLSLCVGVENGR